MSLSGCIAAVPLVVRAMKGKKHSTATVLINEDADKIYTVAVETIHQQGYTKIEKQDPKKRYIEGIRDDRHATFKAIPEGKHTRVILTMERQKDEQDDENLVLDSAVQALMEMCQKLGFQCKLEDS